MYLGIEIGGTKLQIGLGAADGAVAGLWRGAVDVPKGAEGIRQQILTAIPELLRSAGVARTRLKAAGVGFGGPIDDATGRIIKSHQIAGWDGFPLVEWLAKTIQLPVAMGNDADVAGLAESHFGAGKGLSPVFYITIGSGIGGGLIIDGKIYRAGGRGAAEIGHLRVLDRRDGEPKLASLESIASGWGVGQHLRRLLADGKGRDSLVRELGGEQATAEHLGQAVKQGDAFAKSVLLEAQTALAEAICAVIVLVCPRRIVIGGGVSLIGDEHFFQPLRQLVADRVFPPFAGLTDIVPASLGEAVVVHGALALAKEAAGG